MWHDFWHNRQLGLSSNFQSERSISSVLFNSIHLSNKAFKKAYKSSVNWIDIEKADHRYLLVAYLNGGIAIFDTCLPIKKPCFPIVNSIFCSPNDGKGCSIDTIQWYPHDTGMFVTLSSDQYVKIWDTNELQVAEKFLFEKNVLNFHMAETVGNPLIAVGSKDSNIYLCDIISGSKTHTLKGNKCKVNCVRWSPSNENLLVSGSDVINVWDIRKTKNLLMTLETDDMKNNQIDGLIFASNGSTLLSYASCDGCLYAWNITAGTKMEVNYGGVKPNKGYARTIQIAVTDNLKSDVVFLPSVYNVEALEISTGKRMASFSGHFSNVTCCYYNNAFQELLSGSNDRKILLWESKHFHNEKLQKKMHEDNWSDNEL